MKILVTGATGFVGNHVITEVLKMNHVAIVTSLDNYNRAKKFDWFNEVEYIQCNLNKEVKDFYSYFKKPDLMIHLAWEGLPNFNELYHFEKNLVANYYFIKNMIQNGLTNCSVIGTCLEYGLQHGCLREDIETKPTTPYGLAKDTLRKYIVELSKIYKFDYKWIRLFYLYGKGQNPNSILSQLDRALENKEEVFNMSGGEQLRDYLAVEKVAEYIVKISIQNKINGSINCCSGKPISIKELVNAYLKQKNKNIKLNLGYYPYPDYEPMAFWGDTARLKEVLKEYE